MTNTKIHKIGDSYPFYRFLNKQNDSYLYFPEISLIIVSALSYVYWPVGVKGFENWLLLAIWTFIAGSLVSLAVTNMKYLLLPDSMLKPLLVSVVFYVLTAAALASQAQTASAGDILLKSLIGGLVLGGLPYILFQVSAGRWIGGGDVKLGFIVGLLLGWKLGLIALLISFLFTIFIFFIVGVTQYRLPSKAQVIPTGFIWTLVATGTFIFGNYFF
ncbi:MAG: leader peptidase (prepilin peptidase) / N-methyltransferase [Patescibacteria group bacterium]|nr:leader peptidase (prepilin peptidase) / N-methyltransferase [Patescibacteria group bacterium]